MGASACWSKKHLVEEGIFIVSRFHELEKILHCCRHQISIKTCKNTASPKLSLKIVVRHLVSKQPESSQRENIRASVCSTTVFRQHCLMQISETHSSLARSCENPDKITHPHQTCRACLPGCKMHYLLGTCSARFADTTQRPNRPAF